LTEIHILPYADTLHGKVKNIYTDYILPYFDNSFRPVKKGDSFTVKHPKFY